MVAISVRRAAADTRLNIPSAPLISSVSTNACFAIIARESEYGEPSSKKRCRGLLAALSGAENERSENAADRVQLTRTRSLGNSVAALSRYSFRACATPGFEQVLQLGWQFAMKLHQRAGDRVAKF